MKTNAYVGITGFYTTSEVELLLSAVTVPSPRQFMCGVLVNWTTLNGMAARTPRRFPPVQAIASIFPDASAALNLVHYNTSQPGLFDQLVRMTELAGPRLDGFQLNKVWPNVQELAAWREKYPAHRLVLQVGRNAYQRVGKSPQFLCDKVQGYRGIATDVLFDLSGGRGRLLDMGVARRAVGELYQRFGGELGVGLAGGLSAETLPLIAELLQEFPQLSLDAEGRLRDENDDLDLDRACAYFHKALAMFSLSLSV